MNPVGPRRWEANGDGIEEPPDSFLVAIEVVSRPHVQASGRKWEVKCVFQKKKKEKKKPRYRPDMLAPLREILGDDPDDSLSLTSAAVINLPHRALIDAHRSRQSRQHPGEPPLY